MRRDTYEIGGRGLRGAIYSTERGGEGCQQLFEICREFFSFTERADNYLEGQCRSLLVDSSGTCQSEFGAVVLENVRDDHVGQLRSHLDEGHGVFVVQRSLQLRHLVVEQQQRASLQLLVVVQQESIDHVHE
jgi:hypothetical protein